MLVFNLATSKYDRVGNKRKVFGNGTWSQNEEI